MGDQGFQLFQQVDEKVGKAEHIIDGSTIAIRTGYHPCVVAPGYEMYYFTILGGLSQRSLVQYFQMLFMHDHKHKRIPRSFFNVWRTVEENNIQYPVRNRHDYRINQARKNQ